MPGVEGAADDEPLDEPMAQRANQAAGAARGLWLAEGQRQQQALIWEMTRAWTSSA